MPLDWDKYCARHRDYMRRQHEQRSAAGLCTKCGKPNDSATQQCIACKNEARQKRAERAAAGLCYMCGLPRDDDKKICSKCRLKAKQSRARAEMKKAQTPELIDRRKLVEELRKFRHECEIAGLPPEGLTVCMAAIDLCVEKIKGAPEVIA